MCSKSPEGERRPVAGPAAPRRWSITRRLTLLYVASTAALLLLAGGILYWTLKRNLEHTRDALLAGKVAVLRGLLRAPDQAAALASEVAHEASESQPLKYYIRILDERGSVLLETPGMNRLLPASLFPAPRDEPTAPPESIACQLRPHRSFRLLSVPAATSPAGGANRTVQIGLEVSSSAALLADYRRTLLGGLGAGLVLAALSGAWIARKGMRPLAAITQIARRLTASQLHERIAGAQWPAELAELAAAFDAMLDRLEDSFGRLSQFSADLAHALRTPINNLRGEAEVALRRCRTVAEYQHLLVSSLEECDRLARMIEELLFLARADDPKAALPRVRFDARRELEAVREFYEALAAERHVTVHCEGQAWLVGDPMLFRRAVSNLLGNALRHTPAGGTVRLALRLGEEGAVELSVRDTGTGIAPEHVPRIFDHFYRADGAAGGTGLGLAIVQSIVRLHGGTAAVQSALGQGTTVTLRFPPTEAGGAG